MEGNLLRILRYEKYWFRLKFPHYTYYLVENVTVNLITG